MPTRRKPLRRRAARGPRLGRLLVALLIVAVAVVVAVVVGRQFAGYFAGHKAPPKIAVIESPTPTPAPTSVASAAPSQSSTAVTSPRIALIIDDCGYSLPRDLRFLKLNIPVTLSILPMTPHGKEVAEAAQAAGKSVMLHLPMEPQSAAAHPGPGEITTEMT